MKILSEELKGYAKNNSLAPEFSTSSTYAVNDVVTYQSQRYRCITAVSTAGEWNSINWTLEDVQTAIENVDIGDSVAIIRDSSNDSAAQVQTSSDPIVSGTENIAISQNSLAVGASNVSGLKGYRYTNTGSVTNSLTFEVVPEGWAAGDVVSVVNNTKYPDCATIESISGTTVTFTANLPFDSIASDSGWDAKTAYVSAKPNIGNVDLGYGAKAEGVGSKALNIAAHAEGRQTKAYGAFSHAEGRNTEAQWASHAEGLSTKATGEESHSEGSSTTASGNCSHAEGDGTSATARSAHSEGYGAKANGTSSHAEGQSTTADATGAHAEGVSTKAQKYASHAEGSSTTSNGNSAHAEGYNTKATADFSHAEGKNSEATAAQAHAEGNTSHATGATSHAEGYGTIASNDNAHAEGASSKATGKQAHSEGNSSEANGNYSHAEGYYSIASNQSEHAQGQYNKSNKANTTFGNSGNTIHSIGIGTSTNDRKNAVEVMQDGKVFITGVGGYNGTNPTGSGIKDLKTALDGKLDSVPLATELVPGIVKPDGTTITVDASGMIKTNHSYVFNTPVQTTSTTDETDDTVSVELANRAINIVSLATTVKYLNITFPQITTGYSRDFFVRLVITGDVPAISFSEYGGGLPDFDIADDAWSSMEQGANIIMFTETSQP